MLFNKKFLQPIFMTLLSLVLLSSFLQESKTLVFAQEFSFPTATPMPTTVPTPTAVPEYLPVPTVHYSTPIPTTFVPPGKIKNSLVPNIFQGDISLTPLILNSVLNKIVIILLIASSVIFFFMVITGGIRWMTASGDKEKIAGAKQQLTSAAIGLAITLLIFTIANLIKLLFGVNLLQFTIPKL